MLCFVILNNVVSSERLFSERKCVCVLCNVVLSERSSLSLSSVFYHIHFSSTFPVNEQRELIQVYLHADHKHCKHKVLSKSGVKVDFGQHIRCKVRDRFSIHSLALQLHHGNIF